MFPVLVVIIVGDDPASHIYVASKGKACAEIGMRTKTETFDADITEDELLEVIKFYNSNKDYHGILVQLPLPRHINEDYVIETISPKKDVDGFHPVNVGNLVIGKDTFASCTPAGIQELLIRYKIETKGKHVVVLEEAILLENQSQTLCFKKLMVQIQ